MDLDLIPETLVSRKTGIPFRNIAVLTVLPYLFSVLEPIILSSKADKRKPKYNRILISVSVYPSRRLKYTDINDRG